VHRQMAAGGASKSHVTETVEEKRFY